MKRILFPLAALVLALGVAVPAMADPAIAVLNAGNGEYYAGCLDVSEDADFIYVEYRVWDYWELIETHVAVGQCVDGSCDGVPVTKKGNPKVGKFPYSDPHGPVIMWEYKIPRKPSWTAGTTLCIAAHAVVYNPLLNQEETAWAATCTGGYFPGASWATYFCYTVQ